MRRTGLALVRLLLIGAMLWWFGQILGRKAEEGTTPDDDEFRLFTLMGGREVASHATQLRAVRADVVAGGIDLDLTAAVLDPTGAHVRADITAGGMRLVVHPAWRVYVADRSVLGGIEVDVPDPGSLPPDAPALTIEAAVRGGGLLIQAG